ncbi:MAG: fumarate hydratase [Candidatus Gastranaerophilales bacterium]|nr:fumarate hydratase [Candidatus Gastranaerophilales bacterium]
MIDVKTIKKVVYDLCVQANTTLPDDVFTKILNAYNSEKNSDAKQALGLILQNAQMACEKKMPLCQDTGQVLVFLKGKCFPENTYDAINEGVKKAYEENFFRKSTVKNALFDRTNTQTNTPCVIYTEITNSDDIEIELLIKGAGSENVSAAQMLSPTASEEEILEFAVSVVKKAGSKGCPPYFIGIGIGGTIECAGILSKKALLLDENIDENHENLAQKIKNAVNKLNIGTAGLGGTSTALDVKILTGFTHIACMPVAVTVNCHSSRHAKNIIDRTGRVHLCTTKNKKAKSNVGLKAQPTVKVKTSEIKQIQFKQGQNVLLSGEIYTARDAAHKRIVEMLQKGEKLPFDLKDKVIFYAGPCPCQEPCIVGSIGPTTSARMDKFAPILYKNGVIATIGKGERSEEVKKAIKQTGGVYFTVIGGIACYLSEKFKKKELIAFEDLGTEAVCRFEVEGLPLRVELC